MKLGERIKQLRNEAGLTQPELAVKANIEQSYLSKLENDKGSPSFDVLAKIAQAFEMDALSLIEPLEAQYLQENLAHIPEIAVQLDNQKRMRFEKAKNGYIYSAAMVALGFALIVLGHSNTIFPNIVYQYQSMGFIQKGEVNRHYRTHPLQELAESRAQAEQRIEKNIARLDEMQILTRHYQGESYTEAYGPKRRYFELADKREVESPARDFCIILGAIGLISGGFGLGFVFRFIAT